MNFVIAKIYAELVPRLLSRLASGRYGEVVFVARNSATTPSEFNVIFSDLDLAVIRSDYEPEVRKGLISFLRTAKRCFPPLGEAEFYQHEEWDRLERLIAALKPEYEFLRALRKRNWALQKQRNRPGAYEALKIKRTLAKSRRTLGVSSESDAEVQGAIERFFSENRLGAGLKIVPDTSDLGARFPSATSWYLAQDFVSWPRGMLVTLLSLVPGIESSPPELWDEIRELRRRSPQREIWSGLQQIEILHFEAVLRATDSPDDWMPRYLESIRREASDQGLVV